MVYTQILSEIKTPSDTHTQCVNFFVKSYLHMQDWVKEVLDSECLPPPRMSYVCHNADQTSWLKYITCSLQCLYCSVNICYQVLVTPRKVSQIECHQPTDSKWPYEHHTHSTHPKVQRQSPTVVMPSVQFLWKCFISLHKKEIPKEMWPKSIRTCQQYNSGDS